MCIHIYIYIHTYISLGPPDARGYHEEEEAEPGVISYYCYYCYIYIYVVNSYGC